MNPSQQHGGAKPTLENSGDFQHVYNRYFEECFRFALIKTSDREIAIDICQEAFVKLWQQMDQGIPVQNPRAYVYRVIHNKIIDHYRKKKHTSLDMLQEQGYDAPDINRPSDDEHRLTEILNAFQELPDPYRDIIIMRYVMNLSITEISDRTGLNENVVSVRIHRGKEYAQKILSDMDIA